MKIKALPNGWSLINGEEMNQQHPESFHIPAGEMRNGVEVGAIIKLGLVAKRGGERFWVKVLRTLTTPKAMVLVGQIQNHLMNDLLPGAQKHGLRAGDLIQFGPEHVLEVYASR